MVTLSYVLYVTCILKIALVATSNSLSYYPLSLSQCLKLNPMVDGVCL